MGRGSFHGDAAHLELRVPRGILLHSKCHTRQLCLIQHSLVEGVFAVQGFVQGNDDVLDVVENHGFGHLHRGHVPPVLLSVPRAVLEVFCASALGHLPPFCVCKLEAVHGGDEVSQGFAGVDALFTSRPETSPKHRFFALFEHGDGEVLLPFVEIRILDGVLRLCVALLLLKWTTSSLFTKSSEHVLQLSKLLVTFILRAPRLRFIEKIQ